MRKRSYCKTCEGYRKPDVALIAFKCFDVDTGDAYYVDIGDGAVSCPKCGGNLELSRAESDEILQTAFDARA